MSDIFTCEMCGGVFPKAWTDEEAAAEAIERFGAVPDDEDRAVVCEVCYERLGRFWKW